MTKETKEKYMTLLCYKWGECKVKLMLYISMSLSSHDTEMNTKDGYWMVQLGILHDQS